MSKYYYVLIAFVLLLLAVAQSNIRISSLKNVINVKTEEYDHAVSSFKDSLARQRFELDSLKAGMPGLGEYMTTNQIHAAKLWFAAQANNWKLADYELGELEETLEGSEALHQIKNGVNITNVLESLRQTQIARLHEAVKTGNRGKFTKAYDQTLAMCNGCHRSVGYGFIHIIKPRGEPVTNQSWSIAPEE